MNINVGDGLLFVYVIYPVLLSYTTFPTSTSVDHVVLVLPSLHPSTFLENVFNTCCVVLYSSTV